MFGGLPAPPAAAERAQGDAHGEEAGPEPRPRACLSSDTRHAPPQPSRDPVLLYLSVRELLLLLGPLLLLHHSGSPRTGARRQKEAASGMAQSDIPAAAPGDGPRSGTKREAPAASRTPPGGRSGKGSGPGRPATLCGPQTPPSAGHRGHTGSQNVWGGVSVVRQHSVVNSTRL